MLRISLSGWDDERIVRLYWTLSEAEATFRSLKSELGLLPIYHQRKSPMAHLFISVLAYQAAHVLRMRIRAGGECARWNTVRHRLSTMHRLTTVLTDDRGGEIRARHNTEPSVSQRWLQAVWHMHETSGLEPDRGRPEATDRTCNKSSDIKYWLKKSCH